MDSLSFFQEQIDALLEFAEIENITNIDDPYVLELIGDYKAQDAALRKLWAQYEAQGFGMTVKHSSRQWWAFVLPDASCPGHYRYQVFAHDGFVGHFTYATVVDVLIEMVKAGFVEPAPRNTLDVLSRTKTWELGSIKVDLLARLNSGAITHTQYTREIESINAQLEVNNEAA